MNKHFGKRYIISLGMIFVVFACVMGFILRTFYVNASNDIVRIGQKTTDATVGSVENFLSENMNIVAFIAESVEVMLAEDATKDEIQKFLAYSTNGYQSILGEDFSGLYGVIGGTYIDGIGWKPDGLYNFTERPWYQAALAGDGQVALSSPYLDEYTGGEMISVAILLKDKKNAIGLDLSLGALHKLVQKVKNDGYGDCIVLDQEGTAIASVLWDDIGKNFLKGEAGVVKQNLARKVRSEKQTSFEMNVYGNKDRVFSHAIYSGWNVVVVIDEAPWLQNMLFNVFVCVLVSMVLLLLIIYLCANANRRRLVSENMAEQLSSVASIYISMHVFDLKKDKYQEVSNPEHINELDGTKHHHGNEYLKKMIMEMVESQQQEEVLAFVDLKTLEERMRGRKTITNEFLDRFGSWRRGRFIVIDYDNAHRLHHVIWAIENIDVEKQKATRLLYLSETDAMTGIQNRGSGEKKIKKFLLEHKSGMFCLMDADKFKSINDNYGHDVGDKVIIAIAKCLKQSFRDSDVVLRLGGDEFAAFARGIEDQQAAKNVLERFFKNIADIDIPELGERKITLSLGATFFHENDELTFDALYHQADECTYRSKKIAGNAYTFYDDIKEDAVEADAGNNGKVGE